MRPISELLLALLCPEPLPRETRFEVALLIVQLLRGTHNAPPSSDGGACEPSARGSTTHREGS